VTLPNDRAPVVERVAPVLSVKEPLIVSAILSVRLKPPALLAPLSTAIALPVLVSAVVPADEVVIVNAPIAPPLCAIVPELVNARDRVAVICPAD
jgi:hypothetical protein